MAWTTPQYKRGRVDAAGDTLIGTPVWEDDRDEALTVLNNWRSSHGFPLQCLKMTLLKRAKKVDERAIIAQRLKRLSSIEAKLQRFDGMKLSRMHDIGGCRAVVRTVGMVRKLVSLYEESDAKNPTDRAEFIRKYDYIAHPKEDGYRSVHIVYKYRSGSKKRTPYNGLRIEIQLRSRLQHVWATAVETVSTFTGQALKSNIGEVPWKRFFSLMGSILATRERTPLVPGTPTNKNELVGELRELTRELNVERILNGWGAALTHVPAKNTTHAVAFLLVLDTEAQTINISGFTKPQLPQAAEKYLETEKAIERKSGIQAVLVSVESVQALRSAYPNYYLDTTAFIGAVTLAIA